SGHSVARDKNGPSAMDYSLLFINQLKKHHIDYKEKWYPSRAEMQQALARGEVDAVISGPPYDQFFIENHPDLGIFELRNLYSNLPCCRQLITRDQLKDPKQRAKYVRFERALIRAHKYYKENKLEFAALVAKILKLNPGTVRAVFS